MGYDHIKILEAEQAILNDPKLREEALRIAKELEEIRDAEIAGKPMDSDRVTKAYEDASKLFSVVRDKGFEPAKLMINGEEEINNRGGKHGDIDMNRLAQIAANPTITVQVEKQPGLSETLGIPQASAGTPRLPGAGR